MADIIQDVDEEFELPSRSAASGEDFIDLKKSKKVSVYFSVMPLAGGQGGF